MTRGAVLEKVTRVDQAWRQSAACRDLQSDLFFPDRGGELRRTREICAGCPVWDDCLEYALGMSVELGIWARTSPRQRRAVRAGRLTVDDLRLKLQGA
jgi:WhiB family redox-sensing transcriptional regulator